jgi:isopentenyldiphosphate isomerase
MTSEIEIYKEKIKIFDLQNKFIRFENKFQFYKSLRKEYKEKKKVTKKVHTVRFFLLDGEGKIYLSRRSRVKKENSLLFDKTIGAHIRKNETSEYTLLREAEEELGFAAVVLDDMDFKDAIKETNLRLFGVAKNIETLKNFDAYYKQPDGTNVIFPQITTIFIGVYDGSIKFEDSETDIIELFDIDELIKELKNNPDKYTNDLKILIPKYERELRKTIKLIKENIKK